MGEDKDKNNGAIIPRPLATNIDAVIRELGGFGLFQLMVIFMLGLMDFPMDASIYIMVFHTHKPSWRCVANSTQCLLNGTRASDDSSRCTMNRSEWEYVTPTTFSISTDFDLICDRKWMGSLMSSIIFVGWGIGAVVFGFLADNYGRKRVNYISITMIIAVGIIASFLDSMPLIIVCRLIVGFFVPGASVQSFVLVSEYTDTKYRPLGTFLIFALAIPNKLILLLKAYYIRKWRILQLACTAPYLITLLSFFVVPESIRWLRVKGKQEELVKTLKRVAFWNRRKFPEDLHLEPISEDIVRRKFSPLDVFRTRSMALMSSILGYTWFVNGMIYYAFFLSSGNLGGSMYVNFALMAVIGLPSEAFCGCLCRAIGRKKTTILGMFCASVFCFSLAFLHGDELTVVRISCALIGILFIGISFSAIYTWSVEIYPTTTRANGMAFLQVTSRIGAASAPWVAKALLGVHLSAPYYVMSGTAFIGFLFLFWLPETSTRPMQDVNESEAGDELQEKNLLIKAEG